MKFIYSFSIFFCFSSLSFAQALYELPVEFRKQGQSLPLGFTGGLAAPQYSEIDIDGDGIKDLLIYDRAAQVALPFRNGGSPGQVDYHFRADWMSRFPQGTINFMLARDYNCDGIEDIFYFKQLPTGGQGIGLIRGERDSEGMWQGVEDIADVLRYRHPSFPQNVPSGFFIFNPDLPAIVDIDGDGDMDILTFTLDFTYAGNIQWYRNYSVERGYGCDSLLFEIEHECWGMFREDIPAENNTYNLSNRIDSCANNSFWSPRNPRHLGATIAVFDYDNNGAMDILLGDVDIPYLNLLSNSPINDSARMVQQDTFFPSTSAPVRLFNFPAAYFLDANNDGAKDMIVASNEIAFGMTRTDSTSQFYENIGSDTAIVFDYADGDFLGSGIFDVGADAYPTFVDIDNDGLLDLIVGHIGQCRDASGCPSSLHYLRNVGTATAPAFELIDDNWAELDSLNLTGIYPSFGDLDGDGDLDLILGSADGTITYIENRGTAANPNWANPQRNYQGISVFSQSRPQLVDIDRDGDLDLMIGSTFNNIHYYENTGSATAPAFQFVSSTFGFDLASAGSRHAAPHFVDVDGEFQLFLGHERGGIIHLGGIDGNITGIYDTLSLKLGNVFTGQYSSLAMADINNDDTLDIVIGNVRGGLSFYSFAEKGELISSLNTDAQDDLALRLYPNPSQSGLLNIEGRTKGDAPLQYRVYNKLGQELLSGIEQGRGNIWQLNLSELASGLYFIELRIGGKSQSYKWLRN